MSLAIGDGANDVNMIQEGDIGVGIFGLEGMQAANSSDFAIPEFKGLSRLLFIHGRWSYIRNSEMVLYFFYKNMLFTIPQFYYTYLNVWSGASLFDDWYMTNYNMIFTALPLTVKALFDQDIRHAYLKKIKGERIIVEKKKIKALLPYFYKVGQDDHIFNGRNFLLWILQGIIHGFVIWGISTYAMSSIILHSGGVVSDFWSKSITMFTCVVLVRKNIYKDCNFKIGIND